MTKQPQLIIYTRNRDVDYRMVISPDESLCPPETRKYFRKLIRGAVDVETYDDPLTGPRWLFARKDNVVLFGVALMLDIFGTECCTDFTGRNVRGFYGIVADASDDSLKLPYSIDFFRAVNEKYIEPLWDAVKDDLVRKAVEIDLSGETDGLTAAAAGDVVLNINPGECLVLGEAEAGPALQSALACGMDISLITGLNSKQHAFAADADYDFMNAIVNGVAEREVFRREEPVKKAVVPEKTETPEPYDPQSKKVIRPKMVIAIVAAAAVILTALILLRSCHTTQTSPSSSTSDGQSAVSQSDTI